MHAPHLRDVIECVMAAFRILFLEEKMFDFTSQE